MACNLKHVTSAANNCKENPAGVGSYMMIVPLDSDHILQIGVHDGKNEYVITPKTGTSLKGWKVEFKSQTGQVTSEDNGSGKAWTVTGTGRVEGNVNDMSYIARVLSNMNGKYLCFFPNGNVDEWLVVGNAYGDSEFTVAADTGQNRSDDHGLTFTVSCNYQLYPDMKWHGKITSEEEAGSSAFADDSDDMVDITD